MISDYMQVVHIPFLFEPIDALVTFMPVSMAQLDARPTGDQKVAVRFPPGRQHSFLYIDHEMFYTVIFSLPLIQEEQLSVSGAILVNRQED